MRESKKDPDLGFLVFTAVAGAFFLGVALAGLGQLIRSLKEASVDA